MDGMGKWSGFDNTGVALGDEKTGSVPKPVMCVWGGGGGGKPKKHRENGGGGLALLLCSPPQPRHAVVPDRALLPRTAYRGLTVGGRGR